MKPRSQTTSMFTVSVTPLPPMAMRHIGALSAKSYAQLAEHVLFMALLAGFLVMAGGFLTQLLSAHT